VTSGPLEGLRVLDLGTRIAAPFCAGLLGEMGAEVVKIEQPGRGDFMREIGPFMETDGGESYSLFWAVEGRGRKSITLDLRRDEGQDLFRRLAATADVVVENFRPGVMTRLGLDDEALRAANPGLVYCSITGFGAGRGATLPGYDLLVQALGGLMSITGDPEGEPQKVGVAIVDVVAGLFASVGILAALRHRDRTGEGQRVEVDLLSSLLAALVNQASAYTGAAVVAGRMGNLHPSIAPYALFQAEDGELAIAVGNDKQFAALCGALGVPELEGDPRFATNPARVAHRDELRNLLERALAAHPAAEWATRLREVGVPAGKVNDIEEAFALAEELGLEPIVEIARPDEAPARTTRNPIRLSRTPARYDTAPPTLADARDDGWPARNG
jgi:crotonobetainyl-CoA:carnitine CoA-transferase CaiB-like acyl-CoA transferase